LVELADEIEQIHAWPNIVSDAPAGRLLLLTVTQG
jgi:hypothetical protein